MRFVLYYSLSLDTSNVSPHRTKVKWGLRYLHVCYNVAMKLKVYYREVVILPEGEHKALLSLAKKEKRAKSRIMRLALAEYVKRDL